MTLKPALLPNQAPKAFTQAPQTYLADLMTAPAGEAAVAHTVATAGTDSPAWHHQLRDAWMSAITEGTLVSPLVDSMRSMTRSVLIPRPDNFTPPKRTPWGGTLIPDIKASLGIKPGMVVGESWEISGHPSFPNLIPFTYAGYQLDIPLWLLGRIASEELYGPANVRKFGHKPPFLIKLLNSGSWKPFKEELAPILRTLDAAAQASLWRAALDLPSLSMALNLNYHELHRTLMYLSEQTNDEKLTSIHRAMISRNLSIQIHPDAAYAKGNPAWHSKTEMWVILGAEAGAGIYIGLKEGVTEEQMHAALSDNRDASDFLTFIEVEPGEVFFIPAGTPHAIGAGVLLLEQQETSETTFRYFSWWDGRELHVDDAVKSTHWGTQRGMAFIDQVIRRTPQVLATGDTATARHELLAAEDEFSYDRITFTGDDSHVGDASQGMHGLTVTEGCVKLLSTDGAPLGAFGTGQSFIVPSTVGTYMLTAHDGAATVYIGRSDPR